MLYKVFALALTLTCINSLQAEVVSYVANTPNFQTNIRQLVLNGNELDFLKVNSQSVLEAEIDDQANTFAVKNMLVESYSTSKTYATSVTTGLGQSKDFSIELTARPFTLTASDLMSSDLVPTTGGFFEVSTFNQLYPFNVEPIILDYTITGPTEVVSGQSGALPINELLVSYSSLDGDSAITTTLDANGYPNTVVLGSFFFAMKAEAGSTFPIFDETVDGAEVEMNLLFLGDQLSARDSDISFTSIPEPLSPTFLIAATGFVVMSQRRVRNRNW